MANRATVALLSILLLAGCGGGGGGDDTEPPAGLAVTPLNINNQAGQPIVRSRVRSPGGDFVHYNWGAGLPAGRNVNLTGIPLLLNTIIEHEHDLAGGGIVGATQVLTAVGQDLIAAP